MSHSGLFLVDLEHRFHALLNRRFSKPLKLHSFFLTAHALKKSTRQINPPGGMTQCFGSLRYSFIGTTNMHSLPSAFTMVTLLVMLSFPGGPTRLMVTFFLQESQ